MSILAEITAYKRANLPKLDDAEDIDSLPRTRNSHPARRGFVAHLASHTPGVIAEIKRASPSKGVIREEFNPVEIAHTYVHHGAACLSILTDTKYFQGCNAYLEDVHKEVDIPILRKDFIVDVSQLIETIQIGADCALLIVAALTSAELTQLYSDAKDLGLDVLIEVHNREELEVALKCEPKLIGINNRNLKTFETSLNNTFELLSHIPEGIQVVSESGIHNKSQVHELQDAGVNAFLVGEAFMREDDPGQALADLFGTTHVNPIAQP